MKRATPPDIDVIRMVLCYDRDTGVFTWRHRTGSGRKGRANRPGQRAGSLNRHNGYRYIHVKQLGRDFLEHRLIWLLETGEWPVEMDHINGIRDDNRLANLRSADRQQNACNVRRSNKTGHQGIYYHNKMKLWAARVQAEHKQYTKYFKTLEEAVAAREVAVARLHGEFAATAFERAR